LIIKKRNLGLVANTIAVSTDKALAKELDKDISVVMRKRLIEGYSMDVS
jgi:hypothetical protein